MKTKYIPAGIMLTAGAIASIISIVGNKNVLQSLKTLLVVLIVFYILGLVVRKLVNKILTGFQREEAADEDFMEEQVNEESIEKDAIE